MLLTATSQSVMLDKINNIYFVYLCAYVCVCVCVFVCVQNINFITHTHTPGALAKPGTSSSLAG